MRSGAQSALQSELCSGQLPCGTALRNPAQSDSCWLDIVCAYPAGVGGTHAASSRHLLGQLSNPTVPNSSPRPEVEIRRRA